MSDVLYIDDSDRYSRLRLIGWWDQDKIRAAKVLVAEVPAPLAPASDVELFAIPSARYSCRAAVLLLNLLISRTMSARGGD